MARQDKSCTNIFKRKNVKMAEKRKNCPFFWTEKNSEIWAETQKRVFKSRKGQKTGLEQREERGKERKSLCKKGGIFYKSMQNVCKKWLFFGYFYAKKGVKKTFFTFFWEAYQRSLFEKKWLYGAYMRFLVFKN